MKTMRNDKKNLRNLIKWIYDDDFRGKVSNLKRGACKYPSTRVDALKKRFHREWRGNDRKNNGDETWRCRSNEKLKFRVGLTERYFSERRATARAFRESSATRYNFLMAVRLVFKRLSLPAYSRENFHDTRQEHSLAVPDAWCRRTDRSVRTNDVR